MKTREFLNTIDGFAEIIEIETESVKDSYDELYRYENTLQNSTQLLDNDSLSAIRSARENIVSDSIELVFAKYSIGMPIEEIKKDYLVALKEMFLVWNDRTINSFSHNSLEPFYDTDEYWKILQIISLGILFNVVNREKMQILSIRDKIAAPDLILDFLCTYIDQRKFSFEQSVGDKYNGLIKTINEFAAKNAAYAINDYLKKEWLKDYKRQGFITTHNSKFNVHRGYWSFESGAIMKILNADDTILKGQQFYPYDMVHWN